LIEKGELRNYETYYKAKNGKEIPVLFNASVMKDKAGKINSIVCTGRDITERKQAEDQIKASLKEKELLLKEIHHRVKNNLQVISSLLNLQAGYIKDTQALELFQESQNRIKSMALIHEKLYRSQNLAKIDFKEYIHNLTNYLFRSYRAFSNNIVPKIKVDNIYLGIDTAIPCGLIINELVSNAMKHAFPAGKTGKIWINFSATTNRRHSDKLVLSVRDNGVGFPRDLDFRNTESLGLQLVNTLTKQLKGTIELDRSRGTKFKITFPEPTSKLVHVGNFY
ncbi:MAG: ATP-binding protein, partial [candidate division KSB1 bacterium]|nr:ATP-binding protein [candidate division KSB1 bacterium]